MTHLVYLSTDVAAALSAALALLAARGTASRALARARLGTTPHEPVPTSAAAGWAARRVRAPTVGRRRLEVIELATAVAGELAAGAIWEVAVRQAAGSSPGELSAHLVTAQDLPRAMAQVARAPGAEGMRALLAAGELTRRSGAPAGALIDRVADALRAEHRARRAVVVELAPAVATTRLLAGLPMVGLLLGAMLGASPVYVLTQTSAGRACLLGALILEAGGLLWCRAIRRAAIG